MSIINEALKKAVREKEFGFSSQDRDTVRRNIEIEFQRKKPRFNWGPIFVLLVLVLIAGPIVAPVFSTPFKASYSQGNLSSGSAIKNIPIQPTADIAKAIIVTENSSETRRAQFGIEESPMLGGSQMQALSRSPQLSLSGIVYSPEEAYCIINNKIVKSGDTIRGAKLISISRNTATLDYQGNKITLSVSSD